MSRIFCATFPRSGHGWLWKILSEALGESLHYSDPYVTGKTLENTPGLNFEKNHDFYLDTDPPNGSYVVVQVREPHAAIASWFLADLENKWTKGMQLDKDTWEDFFTEKLEFYAGFIHRWAFRPGILLMDYNTLAFKGYFLVGLIIHSMTGSVPEEEHLLELTARHPCHLHERKPLWLYDPYYTGMARDFTNSVYEKLIWRSDEYCHHPGKPIRNNG